MANTDTSTGQTLVDMKLLKIEQVEKKDLLHIKNVEL